MTQEEAVALALATAKEKGWPEKLRVSVTGGRKFLLFGPYLWSVNLTRSSANLCAWITFDDRTGQVIDVTSRPLNPKRKSEEPTEPSDNDQT